ncbi:CPBP family intramembrane glutamic endopeptidase [Christiangramia portivictoriae]|uniref:CPBP family intramembrane glutamic endopeptidase n=1 Tax=Christiangramia portivictoriae TaxID=326069 RepID=UPI00041FBB88|nr:type II CAAX endopeptidase family protein [Christiangramia portivictoriae]
MIKNKNFKKIIFPIGSIIIFTLLFIFLSQLKSFLPEKVERYSHGIIGTISALASIYLFLKIEKSSFKDYNLKWQKNTIIKFIIGTLIGAIIALIMIFSQIFYSGLELKLSPDQNIETFMIAIPAIIILAFMEEFAFRSYPFIKLNRIFGLRITQITIAILFALYHIANGWSPILSFLGPGIWSLAYGLSAAISNGISMPTGIHSGVNVILALFIGKLNINSVWQIDYPENVSNEIIESNENFGFLLQIILFVICVVATEIYLRRKTSANIG